MEKVIYNGHSYEITYRRDLSNMDYTTHKVYHIKSDNEIYPSAHKDIEEIFNDGSWRKGVWVMESPKNIASALHSYHEFSYNENLDVYVYVYVRPYDD